MGIEDQLQSGEEIVYRAHPSRIVLVPLVATIAVVTIAGLLLWHAAGAGWAVAAVVADLVLGAVLLWKLIVLRSFEYVLTDHRVIRQTGVLTRSSMDAHLDKINNVEHRQTLWGRLLGYGDVEIDTASGTGATVFAGISRPLEWKRAIVTAREAYLAKTRGDRSDRAAAVAPSGAERMRQLRQMLDDGLISQHEFEAKRRQLLAEL
jgi:uncharacterized membrane protein YdbT with pleckstrin-like domain